MNTGVDIFFDKAIKWKDELVALRKIILQCGLTETMKWKNPCYSFQNKNIVILAGLKTNCVLSFFKGALLKDDHKILQKPGENTQAARIIRFTNVEEIIALESVLKSYILEAVEVEKSGLKVNFNKDSNSAIPEELKGKLAENPAFNTAFNALTPGRQKGYILYFSSAKQAKTRNARIDKYMQRILDGKGMNDCTCGLSEKMPACDGSHKQLK